MLRKGIGGPRKQSMQGVKIGVSYDMGWQKRGKGHNSLTGLSPIYDIQ